MRRARRATVARADKTIDRPPPPEPDGLWSIGLLRVAMELRRPGAPALEQIAAKVADRMGLPREEFERHLRQTLGERWPDSGR